MRMRISDTHTHTRSLECVRLSEHARAQCDFIYRSDARAHTHTTWMESTYKIHPASTHAHAKAYNEPNPVDERPAAGGHTHTKHSTSSPFISSQPFQFGVECAKSPDCPENSATTRRSITTITYTRTYALDPVHQTPDIPTHHLSLRTQSHRLVIAV